MGKREATRKFLVFFVAINLFAALFSFILAAEPMGIDDINITSSTRYEQVPDAVATQAGNATEMIINGVANTNTWAGFYGNLTGLIQLADSSGNVMYNWTQFNPSGQIYASNGSNVDWTLVQCFNFTATGDGSGDMAEELGGDYSLYGANLSTLELMFGITENDADGVNETFEDDTRAHTAFYTSGYSFGTDECPVTYVYDAAGEGTSGNFEEVLLWDAVRNNTIFTALLEQDVSGFDSMQHDFEIMVLEDGHAASAQSTTNYYFYAEIV